MTLNTHGFRGATSIIDKDKEIEGKVLSAVDNTETITKVHEPKISLTPEELKEVIQAKTASTIHKTVKKDKKQLSNEIEVKKRHHFLAKDSIINKIKILCITEGKELHEKIEEYLLLGLGKDKVI